MTKPSHTKTYKLPDGSVVRQIGTLKIVIGPDGHGRVYGSEKDRMALSEAMASGALQDPVGTFKGLVRGKQL